MQEDHNPQPRWQPLSALPMLASALEGELENARDHLATLQEVRHKPYVLDDATVARIVKVFGTSANDLWMYEEQLARWRQEALSETQSRELAQLAESVAELRAVLSSILSLADELKRGTIEQVLRKDDAELGLEVLLGMFGKR